MVRGYIRKYQSADIEIKIGHIKEGREKKRRKRSVLNIAKIRNHVGNTGI